MSYSMRLVRLFFAIIGICLAASILGVEGRPIESQSSLEFPELSNIEPNIEMPIEAETISTALYLEHGKIIYKDFLLTAVHMCAIVVVLVSVCQQRKKDRANIIASGILIMTFITFLIQMHMPLLSMAMFRLLLQAQIRGRIFTVMIYSATISVLLIYRNLTRITSTLLGFGFILAMALSFASHPFALTKTSYAGHWFSYCSQSFTCSIFSRIFVQGLPVAAIFTVSFEHLRRMLYEDIFLLLPVILTIPVSLYSCTLTVFISATAYPLTGILLSIFPVKILSKKCKLDDNGVHLTSSLPVTSPTKIQPTPVSQASPILLNGTQLAVMSESNNHVALSSRKCLSPRTPLVTTSVKRASSAPNSRTRDFRGYSQNHNRKSPFSILHSGNQQSFVKRGLPSYDSTSKTHVDRENHFPNDVSLKLSAEAHEGSDAVSNDKANPHHSYLQQCEKEERAPSDSSSEANQQAKILGNTSNRIFKEGLLQSSRDDDRAVSPSLPSNAGTESVNDPTANPSMPPSPRGSDDEVIDGNELKVPEKVDNNQHQEMQDNDVSFDAQEPEMALEYKRERKRKISLALTCQTLWTKVERKKWKYESHKARCREWLSLRLRSRACGPDLGDPLLNALQCLGERGRRCVKMVEKCCTEIADRSAEHENYMKELSKYKKNGPEKAIRHAKKKEIRDNLAKIAKLKKEQMTHQQNLQKLCCYGEKIIERRYQATDDDAEREATNNIRWQRMMKKLVMKKVNFPAFTAGKVTISRGNWHSMIKEAKTQKPEEELAVALKAFCPDEVIPETLISMTEDEKSAKGWTLTKERLECVYNIFGKSYPEVMSNNWPRERFEGHVLARMNRREPFIVIFRSVFPLKSREDRKLDIEKLRQTRRHRKNWKRKQCISSSESESENDEDSPALEEFKWPVIDNDVPTSRKLNDSNPKLQSLDKENQAPITSQYIPAPDNTVEQPSHSQRSSIMSVIKRSRELAKSKARQPLAAVESNANILSPRSPCSSPSTGSKSFSKSQVISEADCRDILQDENANQPLSPISVSKSHPADDSLFDDDEDDKAKPDVDEQKQIVAVRVLDLGNSCTVKKIDAIIEEFSLGTWEDNLSILTSFYEELAWQYNAFYAECSEIRQSDRSDVDMEKVKDVKCVCDVLEQYLPMKYPTFHPAENADVKEWIVNFVSSPLS